MHTKHQAPNHIFASLTIALALTAGACEPERTSALKFPIQTGHGIAGAVRLSRMTIVGAEPALEEVCKSALDVALERHGVLRNELGVTLDVDITLLDLPEHDQREHEVQFGTPVWPVAVQHTADATAKLEGRTRLAAWGRGIDGAGACGAAMERLAIEVAKVLVRQQAR